MFIKRELEKKINERLWKECLADYPELKPLLPYKDMSFRDSEKVLDIVYDYDVELTDMIKDVHFVMTGNGVGFCSKLGKTLMMKKTTMETRVIRALREAVEENSVLGDVCRILTNIDQSACAVGGCVRDSILGKEPHDWDFVSGLDYDTLEKHFTAEGFTSKETGKQFLVLNVAKDGENFEIALFRKDGTYQDGRRPESVEVGTIDDDAERRDFTVNALYFNLSLGLLIDPTGSGIADINDRVLKFVGKPSDRLSEDYLRGWRFYRFLDKGFKPDTKSLRTVREMWSIIYEYSNPQRVMVEVEKMLNL